MPTMNSRLRIFENQPPSASSCLTWATGEPMNTSTVPSRM